MDDLSLGLHDRAYWGDPRPALDDLGDRLEARGFSGILIGAPGAVALDVRESLPIVVIHAGSYREVWAAELDRRALLTAVDLDSGDVFSDFLLEQDFGPFEPPADPREAPEGYVLGRLIADARERLHLPWRPADYLITALLRDQVSNRVRVRLARPGTYEDPAVAALLAEERARLDPPWIHPPPSDPLPSYERLEGSPPLPDAPGIALHVPAGDTVLHGSFRLPARPWEQVKSAPPGERLRPSAIVSITLHATGAAAPAPRLLRIEAPSFDPLDRAAPAPLVTGHFALDLLASGLVPRRADTYFLHAFSGEIMAGPAVLVDARAQGRW